MKMINKKILIILVLLFLIPSVSADVYIGNDTTIPGTMSAFDYSGITYWANILGVPVSTCNPTNQASSYNGTGWECVSISGAETDPIAMPIINGNVANWNNTYNSTYDEKPTNSTTSINISQIVNLSDWTTIYANYTNGHGNGTIIIAPTGADSNRNTSFISSSMWNGAGTYMAEGVSEMPLENNTTTGGYKYNISDSNTYGITLSRAGSISHTTQTRIGTNINTSTMTQNGGGWSFDWGLYNSSIGRRDNRISITTEEIGTTGIISGLDMGGKKIFNSPDINMMWTTGVTSGGDITFDPATGNITISDGVVALRDEDYDDANLNEYVFYGRNYTIPLGTTQYLYISYNGSSYPTLSNTSNFGDINGRTSVTLYNVFYEDLTMLHWIDHRSQNVGLGLKLRRMLYDTNRFAHGGGATIGNPSGLNLSITSGIFYFGLNRINTFARDTSSGDYIEYYYRNGGINYTFFDVYHSTILNNTYWDDDGVPTAMLPNKYKVDWIYLELSSDATNDSHIAVVMGQNEYGNFADAQAEKVPSILPNSITNLGVLVGRVIIEKSAITPSSLESSFEIQFTPSGAILHNNLADLQGGTTNEYYHLTSAQLSALGLYISNTTMDRNLANFTNTYQWVNNTTADHNYNNLTNIPTDFPNSTIISISTYVNDTFLKLSGGSMSGNLNMNSNTISTVVGDYTSRVSLTEAQAVLAMNNTESSGIYVILGNIGFDVNDIRIMDIFENETYINNNVSVSGTLDMNGNNIVNCANCINSTFNTSYDNATYRYAEWNIQSVTTGNKGKLMLPQGTIVEAFVSSTEVGNINISFWKTAWGNSTPTSANVIGWINMSNNYSVVDTSLAEFSTTSAASRDMLVADVYSTSALTNVTFGLTIRN